MKILAITFILAFSLPAGAPAAPSPHTSERHDVIMGTGSSEIYHYYDSEREEKVWGIQPKVHVDNAPMTPITPGFIRPEINVPWSFPPSGNIPPARR